VCVHLANTIPFTFADIRITSVVHAHGPRSEDAGGCRRTTISSPRLVPGPGKGGDDAGTQIQAPDALVLHIGNEEPAATIEKTVVGLAQLGAYPWTTVTTRPRLACPDYGGNDACGGFDLPNNRIQSIYDVDIAIGVDL
jgi:hypothetical protein